MALPRANKDIRYLFLLETHLESLASNQNDQGKRVQPLTSRVNKKGIATVDSEISYK